MASVLLAKKVKLASQVYVYQTLEGHISDVVLTGNQLLSQLKGILHNKPLSLEAFSKAALTVMTFHDYGKFLKEFQDMLWLDHDLPAKKKRKISHALYSALLIEPNLGDELADWVCTLSILSHHSSLYKSLFSGPVTIPQISEDVSNQAKSTFKVLIDVCEQKTGWRPPARLRLSALDDIKRRGQMTSVYDLRDQVKLSDSMQMQFYDRFKDRLEEARQLYALIHMVLKLSDESASSFFQKNAGQFKAGQIVGPIFDPAKKIYAGISTTQNQILEHDKHPLHAFQREAAKCIQPMVLLRAPCGRGKTLAALLYALKQKRSRIIFCLPTQITSNGMVKELSRLLNDPVGFYHGLRKHLKFDEESLELVENWLGDSQKTIQDDYRSDLFYSTPVVVSTVDHLVYSLIRAYPQADVALGNIMSAVVIYDEIHAYEPYTLRQLLGSMRLLRHYGVPQLLMSATLPKVLARGCQKEFGATLIEDRQGLKFSPVIVEKRQKDISKYLDEIRALALKGEKVLVVTNTIARSRFIFDQLSQLVSERFPRHLYNSLFTPHDRSTGEASKEASLLKLFAREATGPAVLVATQAVEMSLNISADVLFTDWCPMDALVQRIGRVNRGSEYGGPENRVVVCPATKEGEPYFPPYFFGREGEENAVLASWDRLKEGPLSHARATQMVDHVYRGLDLDKDEKVTRLFRESTLYGERINILGREDDPSFFNIRHDPERRTLATISVVPTAYAEEFKNSLNGVELYILKVPLYWLHKYPGAIRPLVSNGEEVNGLFEIEAPYNSVTGLSIDQFDEAHTLIV